jgi:hypothetical protein
MELSQALIIAGVVVLLGAVVYAVVMLQWRRASKPTVLSAFAWVLFWGGALIRRNQQLERVAYVAMGVGFALAIVDTLQFLGVIRLRSLPRPTDEPDAPHWWDQD